VAIDDLARSPVQDLASALLVGGAQSQPTGELFLAGKGAEVGTGLGNHRLCREYVDAVDLRPVDSGNAIQLRAQVELRGIPAAFSLDPNDSRCWRN
jgi:hypothetical protein